LINLVSKNKTVGHIEALLCEEGKRTELKGNLKQRR